MASRLVVVASVVALVAAGAIGIGVMSSLGDGSDAKHTTATSVQDVADAHDAKAKAGPSPAESPHPGGPAKAVPVGGNRTLVGGGVAPTPPAASAPSGGKNASGSGSDVKAPAAPTKEAQTTTGSQSGAGEQSSSGSESKSQPGVTGRIVSFDSNRCIDVLDGNPASGTPLQIWDCSDDSWQQWSFHTDGTVRTLGKCMQVEGGSTENGAAIRLGTCNGGAAQKFTLNKRHDLVNIHADKCVDVRDMVTDNGARLQLYTCAGTANQKWGLG
ncbi:ricin-type beta-trefoil lectin domain protein [Streptomyces anthocyanicus]|uniref:ricin-type beta-trefoil lectin domain protein n=1 Tax=Streptomyces anthocyanicus TaxID=68174 RepID=UPI002F90DFD5|nr:ricin-type beta-trefoil lectin domain protein [Streptomyces anthocyanicus]